MKRHHPGADYALDVEPAAGIVINPRSYSGVRQAITYGNSVATLLRPHANTLAPWSTHRRIISHDIRLRDRHLRRSAGNQHIDIVSFTVNDPGEMRCLIALGIDGIQTNYPALLREVADEMIRESGSREVRKSRRYVAADL
jgi:glycerophosphoryl diester phosphodiesterase